jgi:hypothetical protein
MSARPFYETIYHREDWRLADAFKPQPGWGTRKFTVKAEDLGEHTEQELVDAARLHAPTGHRLTSVTLYPIEGEPRVIWSTPPDPRMKRVNAGVNTSDGAQRRAAVMAEVLSDVDPVVLEVWKVQGRKVGAMLSEATEAVVEAHEALREIADDYADRFDLTSPSTNPGIKSVIQQARAVLRGDGLSGTVHQVKSDQPLMPLEGEKP